MARAVVFASRYKLDLLTVDGAGGFTFEDQIFEGLARDIVRHIQQIRKESEFQIQDHITLAYTNTDEIVQTALDEYKDYICRETLCDEVKDGIDNNSDFKEVKIAGKEIKIQIKKAI